MQKIVANNKLVSLANTLNVSTAFQAIQQENVSNGSIFAGISRYDVMTKHTSNYRTDWTQLTKHWLVPVMTLVENARVQTKCFQSLTLQFTQRGNVTLS